MIAALALCAAVRAALGDSSVSYTSGVYTQDFNSLATYSPATTSWSNNTTPAVNLAPIAPVQINLYVNGSDNTAGYTPVDLTGPSADFFQTIQTLSTMTGWSAINFGGNSTPLTYNVDNGSSNAAALTAYYNPNDPINTISGYTISPFNRVQMASTR